MQLFKLSYFIDTFFLNLGIEEIFIWLNFEKNFDGPEKFE